MLNESLLIKHHAILKEYNKGDVLFIQGSKPRFYFQVQSGEIKLFNRSSEGKAFTQSILSKGRGVGEAAILGDFNYLAECTVTKPSKIWLLNKTYFLNLLKDNSEVNLEVSKVISQKLYYTSLMAYENSIESSEHRIMTLLSYLKHTINQLKNPYEYRVDLSRKEIGELTGLRPETVIRAIKRLEKNNKLKLKNHKIYI